MHLVELDGRICNHAYVPWLHSAEVCLLHPWKYRVKMGMPLFVHKIEFHAINEWDKFLSETRMNDQELKVRYHNSYDLC